MYQKTIYVPQWLHTPSSIGATEIRCRRTGRISGVFGTTDICASDNECPSGANAALSGDEAKDRSNQWRDGLPFLEASDLFTSGVEFLQVFNADHAEDEDRFIAIGPTQGGVVVVVVVVVFTEPEEDVIRIISARWATRREVGMYCRHMGEHR